MTKVDWVERYEYRVHWSEEDDAYLARVVEFPSLGAHGDTAAAALEELQTLVKGVVRDLKMSQELVPEPLALQKFSGRFLVRIPPELHRALAIEAAAAAVSLNQVALCRLATGHVNTESVSRSSTPSKARSKPRGQTRTATR